MSSASRHLSTLPHGVEESAPAVAFPVAGPMTENSVIMMIDDEAITLDTIQIFLEDAGYRHFIAISDPAKVFSALDNERPDVILLDLMMPVVDGFHILAHIRVQDRLKHLPVIILTASSDAATKLRALEMGATDFLAKPVDESELVLRLRNTLSAKAYQDRLTYLDRLTGLPNREMLMERLDWAIRHARRYDQSGALLVIDIVRFKRLNEAYGPAKADEVLREVAERLENCMRDSDIVAQLSEASSSGSVARFGGNEFTVLLLGVLTPERTARIAKRLLSAVTTPFRVKDQDIYLSLHIGIAMFPDDAQTTDAVQRNASIAAQSLKAEQADPNGALRFYAPSLNARAFDLLEMESELRHALARQQLEVFYQPKYSVVEEKIIGAECLMRWKHPERGYISPMEFIPIAEESGLILEAGRYVIDNACRQLARWQKVGYCLGKVAINVSPHQFHHETFLPSLKDAFARHGVSPEMVILEVTESLLMSGKKGEADILGQIRRMGIGLSIDDFGTGYSSLSYLRTLPINELKIDRSFLIDVETSKDSAAIVRAILALAHSLELQVVAEGVETAGQLAFLRRHACDACQGFLFSRPLPAKEFEQLIAPAAR